MGNKSFIFLFVLIFMIVLSISSVSADDLQTKYAGEVSGDVNVVTVNPWTTSGSLTYDIPSEAKDIRSADVYVNVYGGSAKNTYGANANVSLKTANGENQIANESLWIEEGSSDGTIYAVNDHINKCYSDYQMHYDITNSIKGLNGSSITIKVDTFKMENKSFDGRIKLIALILAYDDGDSDVINYWVDATQKWTKTNVTTIFNTEKLSNINGANLINVALSSGDGSFKVNGEIIGDPIVHDSGNYYQYNSWDISDKMKKGQNTELLSMNVGSGSYASLKNVLSVLKVNPIKANVSLATEYADTCYAGTNNTISINVISDKKEKYSIELLADGNVVNSTEIELDGENQTILFLTDPTVREVDDSTVNGADNVKVNYMVNVRFNDVVVSSANKTVPVLYNGNLGKDLSYPSSGFASFENISFTGDIVIDIKNESSYKSGSTGTIEIFNVNLGKDSTIVKGFIYVPYNWFNGKKYVENETMFNVTFNNQTICPAGFHRDQSNLGNYGKYGYGVVVYDVTNSIKNGNNTFVLNKINPTPTIYPSTLIYMYNTTGSEVIKNIYIINGADLLSNTSNNAGRVVQANSNININSKDILDAKLYVFASGAQTNEGNIIINNNVFENVWNGTSKTTDLFATDITDIVKDSNDIRFVATGSTILALQQFIVTTKDAPIKTSVKPTKLSTTYDSGKYFNIKVLDNHKKSVKGLKLKLKVFTGKRYANYYVTTGSNGVASFKKASKLSIGTHKVEITTNNKNYVVKKTISYIKVYKAKTIVKAPKITVKFKKSKYFKVNVKNKATKKAVKNIAVKLKVFTGKKYKIYKIKTNKYGTAYLKTKYLKVGSHKVIVYSGNSKYSIGAKSSIKVRW
ncbi:MAG: DUF3344 domain-containing protein [archaeon]|nr:DUF3344 domain-containing protein [archaeon]